MLGLLTSPLYVFQIYVPLDLVWPLDLNALDEHVPLHMWFDAFTSWVSFTREATHKLHSGSFPHGYAANSQRLGAQEMS